MDDDAPLADTSATSHDFNSAAALQAFEKLSLQSQTPTNTSAIAPRPSTSSGVPAGAMHSDGPSQGHFSHRASGSLISLPSPEVDKRMSISSLKGAPPPSSPRLSTSRRSSNGLPVRPATSMSFASAIVPTERPPPRTAATVGAEYFAKELAAHEEALKDTETVVILHEACYGHRFSRPKTSKSALSMIVERPERITAAVLGLATAYVRLGSRHSGGANPPAPGDTPAVPPPFAIRKSTRAVGLLSSQIVAVHGSEWMGELQTICMAAGARLALDGKELLRPQKLDTVGNPVQSQAFHEGDLYLCEESLGALQGAIGGVCDAVDAVFSEGLTKRAFVAVRPPGHHCSADFPSGFCWLNNVHVGIQYAAQKYGLTHAVILDFDLHHGDGSQDITWDLNEKNAAMPKNTPHSRKISIGYYSLHDINSYPCEIGDKEKVQNASLCLDNAHGQSIWNVHLEPWRSEEEFSQLYEEKYSVILTKAKSFLQKQTARIRAAPKGGKARSAVFISAGFDASQWEGAGMQRHAVNVPTSFYERFTRDAVQLAQDNSTAAEGRVVSVLEGGYSNRALTSGVLSHITGLCQDSAGLASGETIKSESSDTASTKPIQTTDPSWWTTDALAALENYQTVDAPAPKKPQRGFVPTFASPTESFSQKVVDQEKFQRSMSGTMRFIPEPVLDLTIPAVDWVAASHSLCTLLVPTHRTTTSCKAEDLAAPKVKKVRQSLGPVAVVEPTTNGRQLRDRRAKPASNGGIPSEDISTPKIDRRKTMAVVDNTDPARPERAGSKRSSAASGADVHMSLEQVPDVPAIPASFAQPPQEKSTPRQTAARGRRKSPSKTRTPAAKSVAIGPSPTAKGIPSTRTANTPPASAPAKQQPTNFTPLPSLMTESSSASFATAQSSVSTPATTIPTADPSASDLMDGLTSGIKRITLKLPTREEHDRRVAEQLASAQQQQQEQAENDAAAKDKRKPRRLAAGKTRRFEAEGGPSLPLVPPPEPGRQRTGAALAPLQTFRPAGVANGVVMTHELKRERDKEGSRSRTESPRPAPAPAPAYAATSPLPQPSPTADTNASYAAPKHNVTAQQIAGLSDIDATPQPVAPGQGDRGLGQGQGIGRLPTFSATGSIPFGASAAAAGAATDTIMGLGLLSSADRSHDGNGVSRSMLAEPELGGAERGVEGQEQRTGGMPEGVSWRGFQAQRGGGDIWEVPETPRR